MALAKHSSCSCTAHFTWKFPGRGGNFTSSIGGGSGLDQDDLPRCEMDMKQKETSNPLVNVYITMENHHF